MIYIGTYISVVSRNVPPMYVWRDSKNTSVVVCLLVTLGPLGAFLDIKPELDLTFMSHIPNQTLFWPFTFTLGLKGMVKGIALDTYLVRYVAQ